MDAITVSHNNRDDLLGLLANEPLMGSFDRIVLVDDGSSDDSAELGRAAGLHVIRRDRPGGYGAAVNAGAREVAGDFFAVLNPDIRFIAPETVPHLRHHFMHEQVGIAAPALRLPDGRLQDSARRVPTPMNLLFRRWIGEERGWVRRGGDVEWTVGACWVVRRAAWEAVGGFDERYFLYFEDVDLCHRMRGAGWQIRFDPTVEVEHAFQAASRRSFRSRAVRLHVRSAVRFFAANPRFLLDPRPSDIGPPERRRHPRLPERRRSPR